MDLLGLGKPLPGGAENCPILCQVKQWCEEIREDTLVAIAESRFLLEQPELAWMLFSGELTPSTNLLDPAEQDLSQLPETDIPDEELISLYASSDTLVEHAQDVRRQEAQTHQPDEVDYRTTLRLAGERLAIVKIIGSFVSKGCATGPKEYPSFISWGDKYVVCGADVAYRYYDAMHTIRNMMANFNDLRDQGQNPDPLAFGI